MDKGKKQQTAKRILEGIFSEIDIGKSYGILPDAFDRESDVERNLRWFNKTVSAGELKDALAQAGRQAFYDNLPSIIYDSAEFATRYNPEDRSN
ncbi:MAG: hypothetical protein Q7S74_02780 [Nanoarchaeota archaeon]|nr:hypothetical protein [Nanoarchaeota archaeon]